jgi:hypothetical protein
MKFCDFCLKKILNEFNCPKCIRKKRYCEKCMDKHIEYHNIESRKETNHIFKDYVVGKDVFKIHLNTIREEEEEIKSEEGNFSCLF